MKRNFYYITLLILLLIINDHILAKGKNFNTKKNTKYWERKLHRLHEKYRKVADIINIEREKKNEMRTILNGKNYLDLS
jgi:hypothetical protein